MPAPAQPAVLDETPHDCKICHHVVPKFSFRTSPGVEGEFCENCINMGLVQRGFVNAERQRDYIERPFIKNFNGHITAPATFYYDRRLTNPTAMGFVYSPDREQWILQNQTVPDRFTGLPLLFTATVEHYLGGAIAEHDAAELYNGMFAHAYRDDLLELSAYSEHRFKYAVFGRGPDQVFPLRMPDGKRYAVLNSEGPDVAEKILARMKKEEEERAEGKVRIDEIGSNVPSFIRLYGQNAGLANFMNLAFDDVPVVQGQIQVIDNRVGDIHLDPPARRVAQAVPEVQLDNLLEELVDVEQHQQAEPQRTPWYRSAARLRY